METDPPTLTLLQQRVYDEYQRSVTIGEASGGIALAKRLGLSQNTVRSVLRTLRKHNVISLRAKGFSKPIQIISDQGFSRPELPNGLPSIEELKDRRRREWSLRDEAETFRSLIPININIDGPIGVVHMGDPHVDDPGTNFPVLEKHIEIIRNTPGLFGANVGDQQNNWAGRLAHLHSEQTTRGDEAWILVEWLVTTIDWLYILGGNHDCWSGVGDPLHWMLRQRASISHRWGIRVALHFPNGKVVRINARHDFAGTSMWNPGHGPMKAAQAGWRDHILTCGHKHISAYGVVKCPATGLISHCIRVAGYKVWDKFGQDELGLPNQNISPAYVTIIDPKWDDDDPRLITTIFDVETAAKYLMWLRKLK